MDDAFWSFALLFVVVENAATYKQNNQGFEWLYKFVISNFYKTNVFIKIFLV